MLKREERHRRREYVKRLESFPSFVDIGMGSANNLKILSTEANNAFEFGGCWFSSLFNFIKAISELSNKGGESLGRCRVNIRYERHFVKSKLKNFQGNGAINDPKNSADQILEARFKNKHFIAGGKAEAFWWNGRLIFWASDAHRKLIQSATWAMIFQNPNVMKALRSTARKHLVYRMSPEENEVFPFSEERFGQIWERIRPAVILREKKYNYKREKKLNQKLDLL